MKLKELSEGINTTEMRQRFRDTLENHKEVLQKKMTTFGVTRTLSKIFPEADFSMFGGKSDADYHPETDKLTVRNNYKLMKPSYVRQNWEHFVEEMVSVLTHETIHREQNQRGGVKQYKNISAKREQGYGRQYMKYAKEIANLRDLHDDALNRGHDSVADDAQKKINKIITNAKRNGLVVRGTTGNYLSDPQEVTAYAEEIAQTYVDLFSKTRGELNDDQVRSLILGDLKSSKTEPLSPSLQRYRQHFNVDNKTLKRLYKQIVFYVDQKLKN